MKKIFLITIIISLVLLSSCKPDYVPLIESSTETLESRNVDELVSKETIVKPTINLESIFAETSKVVVSSTEVSVDTKKIEMVDETAIAVATESVTAIKDAAIKALDLVVTEDDRVFHGTDKIDTDNWVYGMTPCEWVYIEPGIQLVSNYKPNTSKLYSANGKVRTSSGLKGCYIPIFRRTDMMSNTYDGRFYVFEDYTKAKPDEMLFDNSLHVLKYKDLPVEDILRMGMPDIVKTDNGLLKVGDQYINIVYVTDLDKILNAKQ